MKDIYIKSSLPVPEQMEVIFESSGSQGGDAGHGGTATLTLQENGSDLNLNILAVDENGDEVICYDSTLRRKPITRIHLTVSGDWELEGFATSLAEIGLRLLQRDDVLEDIARWRDSENNA